MEGFDMENLVKGLNDSGRLIKKVVNSFLEAVITLWDGLKTAP